MILRLLEIREAVGENVNSPESVANQMIDQARADRECLWVMHLNNQSKVLDLELVAMGTVNMSFSTGREVYRRAVINSTVSVILIHNHPGGDPAPSKEDIHFYERLKSGGELLGIAMLDFIIITPGGKCWSQTRGGHFTIKMPK